MTTNLPEPIRARCPVCGDSAIAATWRCARCETPHHAECAAYFGGCAIFGCRDGRLPERLEVDSWPEAARQLTWYLRVRRVQWGLLYVSAVAFGAGLFLIPVFEVIAGLPKGSLEHVAVTMALTAVFAGLPLYALASLVVAVARGRLTESLGLARTEVLDLPRMRLRSTLPTLGQGSVAARWVERLGWIGVALTLLCMLTVGPMTFLIAFPALVLVKSGRMLAGYVKENEAIVHRFEATFAPQLPEKQSGEKATDRTLRAGRREGAESTQGSE